MPDQEPLRSFVQVLEHLREPLLFASAQGHVLAANAAAAESLGTSVNALVGTPIESYCVHPARAAVWLSSDRPFPVRSSDGRRYFATPSAVADDLVMLRLSTGADVDARSRVLHQQLQWLRSFSSDQPDAVQSDPLVRSVLSEGMTCLGAFAGGVFLANAERTQLELVASVGYPAESVERYGAVPLTVSLPLVDAYRKATPILVGSPEDYRSGYPQVAAAHPRLVRSAVACLPLEADGRVVGVLGLGFPMPWSFSAEDQGVMTTLARQCLQALSGGLSQDQRSNLRPAATRLEVLNAFTGGLAGTLTWAEVCETVVETGAGATSADASGLWLTSDDGTFLTLIRTAGQSTPKAEEHRAIPLDGSVGIPVVDAARSGAAVWIESCDDLARRYPAAARAYSQGEDSSLACVPLLTRGQCIGALTFRFAKARSFAEEERAFIKVLAWHSAQAIERTRMYGAAKESLVKAEAHRRRSELIADTSMILASSLDFATTLQTVARAAVPRLADWCLAELADGTTPPVAAHADPSKTPLVLELRRCFRALGNKDHGVVGVIRTGQSQLFPAIDREGLTSTIKTSPELLDVVAKLGLTSTMVVPISARGQTLGAILLNYATPGRHYDERDLATAEDLGRRIGLALDNARLYREAREADQRKDEFLAMLSHELRNPLAPIVAALGLMELRGSEAFVHERQMISKHVKHIVRLVDDLLEVSRITRGKIELHKVRCQLSEVVADAVEMASPLIVERAHHLRVSVAAGTIPIFGDRARLAQAVVNLLTNAAKYTDPGGEIAVTATVHGSEVLLTVSDTGRGIAPELLPKVFDLFVQAAGPLDRSVGGLGIGLSVVRSLIELHGGSVSARSAGAGKGSELALRLPLAPPDLAAPEQAAEPITPIPGASALRVLVVDDNRDVAESIGDALDALGCSTVIAHDGATALHAAAEFRPQLALLDIGLPVMNGYELARRLRQLGTATRLIAVTGYGQDSDRERSRDAGFDEHVVKPLTLQMLRGVLARTPPPAP